MAAAPEFFCRKMFFRMFMASGISGLALALSNIIDSVCIGSSLGSAGLAAVGIVSPVYILYNVAGYGFSVGGSVTFTKMVGEGDDEKAVSHFNEMLETLIVFSLVIAVLGNILLQPMVTLLCAESDSSELFGLCCDYVRILITAFPVFMLNFFFNDFLRCDNDQNRATAAFVTGCLLDFALNILFVLVLHMGVTGSAYATAAAQLTSVIISMGHFFGEKHLLKIKPVKPDMVRCGKSVLIGFSTSVESLFLFFYIFISNRLLMHSGKSGEMYVAIFDVVMNISYITNSMFLAAGETLRPLAGNFYAEHNRSLSKYALRLSLKWGYIINALIIGAIYIFSENFAELFGMIGAENIAAASSAVKIFCISALLSGAAIIISSYYQSTDREKTAMAITSLRSCIILIAVTVLLCRINISLFWYAMPLTETATLVITAIIPGIIKEPPDDCRFMSCMLSRPEDIGNVLEKTESFCVEHNMSVRQMNMIIMFIEETCTAIIQNAFCGDPEEYIQITVAVENTDDGVLHVRDSAVKFNPFDMKTAKMGETANEEMCLNAIGILMMKKKAKHFYYRRYQGFNMLTIKF